MKKIIFFCVFNLLLFNAYSDSLDNRIAAFWNFVSNNERNLFNINSPESPLYMEIYNQIQLIDKNIYVMLSNEIKNNRKDIIITAGGNAQYFDLCDRIVNLAPRLRFLNPISLFPRLERIEPFIVGNIVFSVEDVRVNLNTNTSSGKIELLFLLNEPHLSHIRNDSSGYFYSIYMQMLFTMTQQILGERIVGEKIGSGAIALVNLVIPSIPLIEIRNNIK